MGNFWDFKVWGGINIIWILLISMLAANMIKRSVPFLKKSLIPTSVLGGTMLLLVSIIYKSVTGEIMFDTAFFGGNGTFLLEVITYHSLAIGFIATSFKSSKEKLSKKRSIEIFDTGVTTVATYLIQAVVGMGITMIIACFIKDFFAAGGLILPFGYGQGTGQALNYGTIYENDYGFVGGKSFGLTIAAFGFLSAAIGGMLHLNIVSKKKMDAQPAIEYAKTMGSADVQGSDEIPMNGSMDKFSVQLSFVAGAYLLSYIVMYVLGNLLPGLKSVIYGFNFLFGVLMAVLISTVVNTLRRRNIVHRQYFNTFLMNRIGGVFFDLMIVAGIAAIRVDLMMQYWWVLIILGAVGALVTYWYTGYVAKKIFPEYAEQQFLAMYGMLTGTASTGVMLLKEVDSELESPVSQNLVYQTVPASVFGFPLMLLAVLAPVKTGLTLLLLAGFFVVMNIILFRRQIFKRKNK